MFDVSDPFTFSYIINGCTLSNRDSNIKTNLLCAQCNDKSSHSENGCDEWLYAVA